MVTKALAGTGEKDSTVFTIIVAVTAAAATLRSGTGGHGWINVGVRRGKRQGNAGGLGGGDGSDENTTYLNREEKNPPLDWIVSTTCVFPDGPCSLDWASRVGQTPPP